MLKIIEESNRLVKREIGRSIVLDIGENRYLEIYKFSNMDESAEEYNQDWEWESDASSGIFENLTEDEQDQITEHIESVVL